MFAPILKSPVAKLIFWSCATILILLSSMEVIARQPMMEAYLQTEFHGDTYIVFHQRLELLNQWIEEHGQNPDCFFVGSSMTNANLHPDTFEMGYEKQTGQTIECFNFGVFLLSPETGYPIADYLVKTYSPKLLIYGTAWRDFYTIDTSLPENRSFGIEAAFAEDPWLRYTRGDFNLRGWLAEHSVLYRTYLGYRLQLEDWQTNEKGSKQPHVPINWKMWGGDFGWRDGFAAYLGFYPHLAPAFMAHSGSIRTCNSPDKRDLDGLAKLGQLHTQVMVVEMPLATKTIFSSCGDEEYYGTTLHGMLLDNLNNPNIPVWRTSLFHILSDLDWSDNHLQMDGAIKFSDWLGQQVGLLANAGFLEGTLPEEYRLYPPEPYLTLQDPAYYATNGLSEENYGRFRQEQAAYSPIPLDALVLNPDDQFATTQTRTITALGIIIDAYWNTSDSSIQAELPNYLTSMSLLDQVETPSDLSASQRAKFNQWFSDGSPEHLRQAQIDYILISYPFWRGLSPLAQEALMDGQNYHLIRAWQHEAYPSKNYLYFLLQPINKE